MILKQIGTMFYCLRRTNMLGAIIKKKYCIYFVVNLMQHIIRKNTILAMKHGGCSIMLTMLLCSRPWNACEGTWMQHNTRKSWKETLIEGLFSRKTGHPIESQRSKQWCSSLSQSIFFSFFGPNETWQFAQKNGGRLQRPTWIGR